MNLETLPKLYQYNVCPFCWKVKALLHYKKIPYQSIEVHPLNKKEISFSKTYKKVPIYIDRQGKQHDDSTPIMQWIDQEFSENPVFSKEGKVQEEENKWLQWADATLVRSLPPLIYGTMGDALKAFDYITQEEKFSWWQKFSVKYSGALVMNMIGKRNAKQLGITNPTATVLNHLQTWAQALAGKDFLGGNKPNGADLAIYGILKSIETLPAFSLLEKVPKVLSWYENVRELTPNTASFN